MAGFCATQAEIFFQTKKRGGWYSKKISLLSQSAPKWAILQAGLQGTLPSQIHTIRFKGVAESVMMTVSLPRHGVKTLRAEFVYGIAHNEYIRPRVDELEFHDRALALKGKWTRRAVLDVFAGFGIEPFWERYCPPFERKGPILHAKARYKLHDDNDEFVSSWITDLVPEYLPHQIKKYAPQKHI